MSSASTARVKDKSTQSNLNETRDLSPADIEKQYDRVLAIRSKQLSSRFQPLAGFHVAHLLAPVSKERFAPQVNPTKHSLLIPSNISESEMQIDARRKTGVWQPGDVVLVPRGISTNGHSITPSQFVHLLIEQECLDRAGEETDRHGCIELVPILQARDELLRHLAHTLIEELAKGPAVDTLYAEILARAIAAHIVKNFRTSSVVESREYRLPLRVVGQIVEYVAENLGGNVRLDHLAAVTGVSASKLHRQFKLAMGEPLHRYVMRQRVKRARELLAGTKLTIAQIAHLTGFADQSHLTRMLRQYTGLTPKAFRLF